MPRGYYKIRNPPSRSIIADVAFKRFADRPAYCSTAACRLVSASVMYKYQPQVARVVYERKEAGRP